MTAAHGEGGREALQPPRAPARAVRRHRQRHVSRHACARATRRTCSATLDVRGDPRRAASGSSSTTATPRRRSCCRSLLGPLEVEAVTAHGFTTESAATRGVAARVDRPDEAARRRDRRRPRRRLRPRRRAAVPRRRAGPRDPGRADAAAVPAPDRRGGARGARSPCPITVTSRVEEIAGEAGLEVVRTPAAPAELTRAAAEDGVVFAGAARRRLRLPAVPAGLRRGRRASASCSSCSRPSTGRCPSSSPTCPRSTRRSTGRSPARGR